MRSAVQMLAVVLAGCAPDGALGDLPMPMAMAIDHAAVPLSTSVGVALPGHPLAVDVSGVTSGARVYLVGGDAVGAGPCPPQLRGGCLDVVAARLVGSATATSSGRVEFQIDVARAEPVGGSLVYQAVVLSPSLVLGEATTVEVSDPGDVCQRGGLGVWDDADASAECDMLVEMNEVRALGYDCGTNAGLLPATHPLTMNKELRDAARVHSEWMQMTGSFGHPSPGGPLGDTIGERATNAGYRWRRVSENVARGATPASSAIGLWLGSSGHCANLMSHRVIDAGVGRIANTGAAQTHWTADFGTPQ